MSDLGFLVKSDAFFFEGLKVTLASLRFWHPEIPVRVLDCGLTEEQNNLLINVGYKDIVKLDLSNFQLFEEGKHLYSNAVFAILMSFEYLFEKTFHIDVDAIICKPINEILFSEEELWLKAVPDYPYLTQSHQIGSQNGIVHKVKEIIPYLDMNAITFNAGIFYLNKHYFQDKMYNAMHKLIPLHNQLWGNEMAILNLAAYYANPAVPFQKLHHVYNHRPYYRRAQEIPRNSITGVGKRGQPMLTGHFGEVSILHFIGEAKPWGDFDKTDPSFQTWNFYSAEAEKIFGN